MKWSGECLAGDTKVVDNWRELQLVEEEAGNRIRINRIRKQGKKTGQKYVLIISLINETAEVSMNVLP
jgi:hypothetical protein